MKLVVAGQAHGQLTPACAERMACEQKNIESTNSEELYGTDEDYERDGTGGTGTEESD